MIRVLVSVLLLASSATTPAAEPVPANIANLSDEEIGQVCAERTLQSGAKADLARRANTLQAPSEISELDLVADAVCQVRLQNARLLARLRAHVDADQVHVNRLLGRLEPGEGYHIVITREGRIVHSPRAVYYRHGRAVPAYAPAPPPAR